MRLWAIANPEKKREHRARTRAKPETKAHRAAYQASPRGRKLSQLWRDRNREKLAALHRAYQQKNPHKVAVFQERRRSRKLELPATLTAAEWLEILEIHDHRCAYCLRKGVKLEIEHVVSVVRGGPLTPENVVPACRSCNAKKGGRPVFMMAQYI